MSKKDSSRYVHSKNAEIIQNRLSTSRGEILQQQIACEQLLTQILTYYYGGKKFPEQNRIHRDLISKLPFSRKIQLICLVLTEYEWDKRVIKSLRKDLEYIREVRNNMAHMQWHIMTEENITFGLSDSQFSIDNDFALKFKELVLKTERPLFEFFMNEFTPLPDRT